MINKITDADLEGKGVIGMPDVPGLSTEEMQEKMEETVRSVAIAKINELIDYLVENGATKEDLDNLIITAGAVTSVFGRAGKVTAQSGDYTAEMVGAATQVHSHGGITADGKLGGEAGKIAATGSDGVLQAKTPAEAGLLTEATPIQRNGVINETLIENADYKMANVTSLTLIGAAVNCHGFIHFSAAPTNAVNINGFGGAEGTDELLEAEAGNIFEFSCVPFNNSGYIIFKKWGE